MDDNTYRWLTAVITPLLSVVVTAVSAAGAALLATRWEAKRADERARQAARREAQLRTLEQTQSDLLVNLYAYANALMRPGYAALRVPPLSYSIGLLDPAAVAKVINLGVEFASRPAKSGLNERDVQRMTQAQQALQDAAQAQADRVRRGEEPAQYPDNAALVADLYEGLARIRSLPE